MNQTITTTTTITIHLSFHHHLSTYTDDTQALTTITIHHQPSSTHSSLPHSVTFVCGAFHQSNDSDDSHN